MKLSDLLLPTDGWPLSLVMPRRINSGKAIDSIIDAMGRIFPLPPNYDASDEEYERLRARFAILDGLADLICLAAFFTGAFLPRWLAPQRDFIFWDIAVMFGLAVIMPSFWILLTTLLSGGKQQLRLYLRFYSCKFGVYWKAWLFLLIAPLALLFIIGLFMAY